MMTSNLTVAATAALLRRLNIAGSAAFAELADVLEEHDFLDRDEWTYLPSPYAICSIVCERIDAEDWSAGTYPLMPSCSAESISLGWGRTTVTVVWLGSRRVWAPTPAITRLAVAVDLDGLPEEERDTHPRAVVMRDFMALATR